MNIVIDILKADEGFRATPYKCPAGRWTIGYGRNFEDNPFSLKELVHILHITEEQAEWLLWNTVNQYTQTLERFGVDVSAHDEVRQAVILSMAFNMGVNEYIAHLVKRGGFDGLKNRDYKKVAAGIRASKAYSQLPKRYERLARMMETGEIQT